MLRESILSLTFDIEMCTNFPYWTSIWDHCKGLIDDETHRYINDILNIARKENVRFQFFLLGRSFKNYKNVNLFKNIIREGHSIGNHTYNHINIKAKRFKQLQTFYIKNQKLLKGFKNVFEVIRYEIEKTNVLIQKKLRVNVIGFRAPYGFENGIKDFPKLQYFLLEKGFKYISSQYNFPVGKVSDIIIPGGFLTKSNSMNLKKYKPQMKELELALKWSIKNLQPYKYSNGLLEMPMMGLTDVWAFRLLDLDKSEWLHLINLAIHYAHKNSLICSLVFHPAILAVKDPHLETIKFILEEARRESIKVLTNDDIVHILKENKNK